MSMAAQRLLVLLMGVSGCGKSTTARLLQDRLPNCVFLEGDDFHPAANRNKMTSGQPLNDQDRAPWLAAIHAELVHRWLDADGGMSPDTIVLACSALKARYRSVLVPVDAPFAALVVYLRVDRDALSQRLSARTDHFFNPALLDSQLSALESPTVDEFRGHSKPVQLLELSASQNEPTDQSALAEHIAQAVSVFRDRSGDAALGML